MHKPWVLSPLPHKTNKKINNKQKFVPQKSQLFYRKLNYSGGVSMSENMQKYAKSSADEL
jgi:hypothetical protein